MQILFQNTHLIAPCHMLIVGTDSSCTPKDTIRTQGHAYPTLGNSALENQGIMTTNNIIIEMFK